MRACALSMEVSAMPVACAVLLLGCAAPLGRGADGAKH